MPRFGGSGLWPGLLAVGAVVMLVACGQSGTNDGSLDTKTPGSAGRDLNPNEERLLSHIPSAIRPKCHALPKGMKDVEGSLLVSPTALAGFDCRWTDVGVSDEAIYLHFESFASAESMYALYPHTEDWYGVKDDCLTHRRAEEAYPRDGKPVGRIFCDSDPYGYQQDISWTDERTLVLAHAVVEGSDAGALYQWWLSLVGGMN